MLIEASVGRQTTTALILKAVTTIYLRASSKLLRTIPLANAYYNTLINPAIVTCFNYRKDGYFAISCSE